MQHCNSVLCRLTAVLATASPRSDSLRAVELLAALKAWTRLKGLKWDDMNVFPPGLSRAFLAAA